VGVVDEPIEYGCGEDRIGEHLAPKFEGLVARDDNRAAFVAFGDDAEDVIGYDFVERSEAKLKPLPRDVFDNTATRTSDCEDRQTLRLSPLLTTMPQWRALDGLTKLSKDGGPVAHVTIAIAHNYLNVRSRSR
jgi:hypothetical protein